jgi:hypothetical protein
MPLGETMLIVIRKHIALSADLRWIAEHLWCLIQRLLVVGKWVGVLQQRCESIYRTPTLALNAITFYMGEEVRYDAHTNNQQSPATSHLLHHHWVAQPAFLA